MARGRRQGCQHWKQRGLSPHTWLALGVVRRLVAQQALADRAVISGAQRDVENDEAAPSPQDAGLRHDVFVGRRGEVLHRQIDAAELQIRVEIDAGPGGQRSGHGQQGGARPALQDPACVQVFGTMEQHDNGTVLLHVSDADAWPFRESDPGETGSRSLDGSRSSRIRGHPRASAIRQAVRRVAKYAVSAINRMAGTLRSRTSLDPNAGLRATLHVIPSRNTVTAPSGIRTARERGSPGWSMVASGTDMARTTSSLLTPRSSSRVRRRDRRLARRTALNIDSMTSAAKIVG